MVKPANVWIQMHVQSKWPATNVVKQHYLWATCWWRIPFRMKYYNSPKRRFNAITKRQQYWFFRLTLDKPSHQTQLQDCLGYPLHLYSSVCLFGRLACGHELKGTAWPRTSIWLLLPSGPRVLAAADPVSRASCSGILQCLLLLEMSKFCNQILYQ